MLSQEMRSLLGNKYGDIHEKGLKRGTSRNTRDSANFVLEEKANILAASTYLETTPIGINEYGLQVGLNCGRPVEDVISGLPIRCRRWKSIYFNPTSEAFQGVAPMRLEENACATQEMGRRRHSHILLKVLLFCSWLWNHTTWPPNGLQHVWHVGSKLCANTIRTMHGEVDTPPEDSSSAHRGDLHQGEKGGRWEAHQYMVPVGPPPVRLAPPIAKCLEVAEPLIKGVVRMPQLAPRMITHENLSSVDRGFLSCTRGPLETQAPEEGQVDLNLIIKRGGYYQYLRDNGYPKHFPLDEHLFPFIQRFTLNDPDADNAAVILEREQLERAILSGRDSMMGTCTFSYLSFPPDYPASIQFPDIEQLGFFGSVTDSVTKTLAIVPAFWEVHGLPKLGFSFPGLSLLPSGSAYASDDYSQFCLLGQILKESIPSWYDRWSVVSSH
ncbi:hypothetical protein Taro_042522 [Colocasia esculenta]|uniref:Uncharacterized protein n=1 Tax=Colocasia esculenta TaxID=4460 RepID=A0A843WPT3_COLES|nr:hypothetical protein [Colocasia esculenta]